MAVFDSYDNYYDRAIKAYCSIIEADEAEMSDDILLFAKLDNNEIVGGSEGYFEVFKQMN